MKYKEVGFRAVYKRFCAFPMTDVTAGSISGWPGAEDANYVLTYGYIDREAGLTLEILAAALREGDSFRFAEGRNDIKSMIRIGAVMEDDFFIFEDEDDLRERYANKIEMLSAYDAGEFVEKTREMDFLDQFRHEQFIDDVQVHLTRRGLRTEVCWVRLEGCSDHSIVGKLLNEPTQDFGYHIGEEIGFFLSREEDGSVICVSNMNPTMELRPEDLEDGSMLEKAISRFNRERTEENFFDVMELLRDSYLWVPCTATISNRDMEALINAANEAGDDLESLVGTTITSKDEIRFKPDILQNGDEFFFPAFTTEEAMGEYGDGFSKIQQHMLDIIKSAESYGNLTGIVINAFTEPFVLESVLFDMVEKLKSRLIVQ